MKHTCIQNLPATERPYEKARQYGVDVLSDAELLAVILRSGTREKTSVELAREVLSLSETFPGLLGLYHARGPELTGIDGIGSVKALSLMCVAELAKRMARLTRTQGRQMRDARDVAGYFMEELRSLETERFYVILLDASGSLIKYEELFRGTINSAPASPREALRLALIYNASMMIILHNHPSGDPTPSPADDEATLRFQLACEWTGIVLSDHIIIGDRTYVSYAESGLLDEGCFAESKIPERKEKQNVSKSDRN